MDFISGVFQWCRDNSGILGVAAAVIPALIAIVGYAVGAAKWAFSLHSLVKSVADGLAHINQVMAEFKANAGKDSGDQWSEIGEHRKMLAEHSEELAEIRPTLAFHGQEIGRIKERLSDV